MTERAYMQSDALTGRTRIAAIGDGDRQWVELETTWFHPQGGGQKADRGLIGVCSVVHVANEDGRVVHYVDSIHGLDVGKEVDITVEPTWRATNARLHSGGHLLSALIEAGFPGVRATGGHHWPGEARVEFQGDELPTADAVRDYLASELPKSLGSPVPFKRITSEDGIRMIQIGNHPAVPCGGTHVESTVDLKNMSVTAVKVKKGKLRISYDIGSDSDF